MSAAHVRVVPRVMSAGLQESLLMRRLALLNFSPVPLAVTQPEQICLLLSQAVGHSEGWTFSDDAAPPASIRLRRVPRKPPVRITTPATHPPRSTSTSSQSRRFRPTNTSACSAAAHAVKNTLVRTTSVWITALNTAFRESPAASWCDALRSSIAGNGATRRSWTSHSASQVDIALLYCGMWHDALKFSTPSHQVMHWLLKQNRWEAALSVFAQARFPLDDIAARVAIEKTARTAAFVTIHHNWRFALRVFRNLIHAGHVIPAERTEATVNSLAKRGMWSAAFGLLSLTDVDNGFANWRTRKILAALAKQERKEHDEATKFPTTVIPAWVSALRAFHIAQQSGPVNGLTLHATVMACVKAGKWLAAINHFPTREMRHLVAVVMLQVGANKDQAKKMLEERQLSTTVKPKPVKPKR